MRELLGSGLFRDWHDDPDLPLATRTVALVEAAGSACPGRAEAYGTGWTP